MIKCKVVCVVQELRVQSIKIFIFLEVNNIQMSLIIVNKDA